MVEVVFFSGLFAYNVGRLSYWNILMGVLECFGGCHLLFLLLKKGSVWTGYPRGVKFIGRILNRFIWMDMSNVVSTQQMNSGLLGCWLVAGS